MYQLLSILIIIRLLILGRVDFQQICWLISTDTVAHNGWLRFSSLEHRFKCPLNRLLIYCSYEYKVKMCVIYWDWFGINIKIKSPQRNNISTNLIVDSNEMVNDNKNTIAELYQRKVWIFLGWCDWATSLYRSFHSNVLAPEKIADIDGNESLNCLNLVS